MKLPLLRFSVLLLCAFFTREVRGDFDPALVSSDARWVVYVDLNALRQNAVGQQLVAAASKIQLQANQLPVQINVPKLLETIGSITASGANFSKDPKLVDGSLVIRGTANLRKIAEALLLEGNLGNPKVVSEVKDLGYSAYALSPSDAKPGEQVIVAFPPEPVVLVSKSEDQIRRTHELLAGHGGQSLASNPDSPLNALIGGTGHATLFAVSLVPSEQFFAEGAPQTRILHMANSGSIALGDDGDKTYARIQLRADSDAMADKLQKILQGMTAMISLATSSDQQLNDFLNSAVVDRKEKTVTLQLAYSSEGLAQMVQHMIQTAPRRPRGETGPDRSLGKVVATWTIPAVSPDPDSKPAAKLSFKTPKLALLNSSKITFHVESMDPRAWSHFDQLIVLTYNPGTLGGNGLLVFPRSFMTESHRPRAQAPGEPTRRDFECYFPGQSGTYVLDVLVTPSTAAPITLSVGVLDPVTEVVPVSDNRP